MDIKLVNYNLTKDLKYSNLTIKFSLNKDNKNKKEISSQQFHSITLSTLINSLRRVIITQIPIYAFAPELIQIDKNISILNNDQYKLKFSQIPILNIISDLFYINKINDYKEFAVSKEINKYKKIEIYINQKNTDLFPKNITTNDIVYIIDDKVTTSPYNKNFPILLTKLRQNEELRCKLIGVIGIGEQNNIWSSVSNIFFYNKENDYFLNINSNGQLTEFEIINKACQNIIYNLENTKNKIHLYLDTLNKINQENNLDKIKLTLPDITIGNLINDQLQNNENIKNSGICRPTYLQNDVIINIEFSDIILSKFENAKKNNEIIKAVFDNCINNIIETYKILNLKIQKLNK